MTSCSSNLTALLNCRLLDQGTISHTADHAKALILHRLEGVLGGGVEGSPVRGDEGCGAVPVDALGVDADAEGLDLDFGFDITLRAFAF